MPELSQLGASGAVVVTVLLFLKFMREESSKRDATYLKISQSLNKNTQATKTADTYLRERNGRDGERHAELIAVTQAIVDRLDKSAITLTSDTKDAVQAVKQVKTDLAAT